MKDLIRILNYEFHFKKLGFNDFKLQKNLIEFKVLNSVKKEKPNKKLLKILKPDK